MADTKVIQVFGELKLRKVPAISNDACSGCFYTNLTCDEMLTRINGRMACTVDAYIWEVMHATIDEG